MCTMRLNYAEQIKSMVTMTDLLNRYGFQVVMGRMPCPFHMGKDRNLSIKANRTYRCWVCGESGDVITFVQRYFGLSFRDALAKLNTDFSLGLPLDHDAEPDARIVREATERTRKANERKQNLDALRRRYEEALDSYCSCDTILMSCRPISPTTGFSDVYAYAAKNIDRLWSELALAQSALAEAERETA